MYLKSISYSKFHSQFQPNISTRWVKHFEGPGTRRVRGSKVESFLYRNELRSTHTHTYILIQILGLKLNCQNKDFQHPSQNITRIIWQIQPKSRSFTFGEKRSLAKVERSTQHLPVFFFQSICVTQCVLLVRGYIRCTAGPVGEHRHSGTLDGSGRKHTVLSVW